jgi:hypothetical protein
MLRDCLIQHLTNDSLRQRPVCLSPSLPPSLPFSLSLALPPSLSPSLPPSPSPSLPPSLPPSHCVGTHWRTRKGG